MHAPPVSCRLVKAVSTSRTSGARLGHLEGEIRYGDSTCPISAPAAVRVGSTRLIDNVPLEKGSDQ